MEDDDPTISYMLQAWARLCKCLGQEFLPYMSVVMPPLLRSAQLKPDVTITDADSEDEGNESDDQSVETITIGDKKIGIRTSVLEEKATACNMLCCYVDELKEGFYPWIDQVNILYSILYPKEEESTMTSPELTFISKNMIMCVVQKCPMVGNAQGLLSGDVVTWFINMLFVPSCIIQYGLHFDVGGRLHPFWCHFSNSTFMRKSARLLFLVSAAH
jgi:hypothetical protein